LRKNWLAFAALSLAFLALAACGKKGNPRPLGLPIPRAISDLRGDAKDGVLFLSFAIPTKNRDGTDVSDLAGFRIMKSCGPCGGAFALWKEIRLSDRQGYTVRDGRLYAYDNDLISGAVYGYRVYPYTTKGVRLEGSNVFSLTWRTPPAKPTNTAATEEESRTVLSWERIDDLTYNVYRWEDGVYPLFPRNPAPLAASQFTDEGLRNGKTYKYEVRAVKMEGTTPFEGEGAAISATPRKTTPPEPPAAPKLDKSDGGVLLSWAPNEESDLAGYNVYRLVAGKTEKINASLVREPRFFDKNPGADLRYVSYYVTAVDGSGNESGPSREQIIILKE
jgi:predicted small lipoprotein YifL